MSRIDQVSSAQNEINYEELTNELKKRNKKPMNPTPLEYSFWSVHQTKIIAVSTIISLLIISILSSVIIVYFKYPKAQRKECQFVIKSLSRNSITNDSRPHSIVIADLNNDGLPDIVVPNSGMNNIGIFIRQQNGSFTDQITYSTGEDSIPYDVVVNHFNQDQQLDIAVANFGSHNIQIFQGRGDESFILKQTFSTGSSRPRSIAAGDFNNDTQLDIAVVNFGTDNIVVFIQQTNGIFADQIYLFTGYDSNSYSIFGADLNHDGKLDIAVANYGTDNVGIFFGDGNANFTSQITFNIGIHSHPYSIDFGHLNNDSYLDIVVACEGKNYVVVLLGDGNGNLTNLTKYSTGQNSSPHSVAIADLNNDRIFDIAVANYGSGSVIILYGDILDGNFSFRNETFYNSFNFNPSSIAIADFNNDNRLDIAVVNYDFNYVYVILNFRNFTFKDQITYTTQYNTRPASIVIADLNNDHHQDMIVGNYGNNNVNIFLGDGNGNFSRQIIYSTQHDSGSSAVAVGDFNNDGRLDIVVANYFAYNISVFLGYGDGSFSPPTFFSTGNNSYPIAIAIGDFNNDNQSDIAVANQRTNNLGVFLRFGDGTFSSQVIYKTGYSPSSVAIGDFNNDNRLDLVVANFGTSNIGIFLGHGDGTFSNQTTYSTGQNSQPTSVAVADFNNDNRSDIIVANNWTDTIALFLGYGNGTFSKQNTFSTGSRSDPYSLSISDFNNDSRLDVVVANCWSENVGVFLGYGNGSFSNQIIYSTGKTSNPWSVAVGDLNDDGHPDIAVANMGKSEVGFFLGFGNGDFTTQQTKSTAYPSNPYSVAVGDFNNDGRLDIMVANYGSDNLGIFLGYGNGDFSSQTTYNTGPGSGPYSIAIGDFNNDSRLDIVVGNHGANKISVLLGYGNGTFFEQITFSTGDNSEPIAVTVGDFNNDGRLDIVVANHWAFNICLFLGYGNGTFSRQVPYSTGPNSGPYSIAIGDFNNDSQLDMVVANYFADNIGVFLGYGNATFSSPTNYSTTKGSRPIDVVVGDLNSDGRLDIVVTLSFGFHILVFLGNGDGRFSRQFFHSTGDQSLPYSCVLVDVNKDNQLDILVTDKYNNNLVLLLGDGNEGFSNFISYSTGTASQPLSVAFGDFNNDSVVDVVVANRDTSTIGIFQGFTPINGRREANCSTGSSSHPRGVALGDFNKDNQMDIVMTNSGLDNVQILFQNLNKTFSMRQTISTGVLSLPTSVSVDDLNSDGEIDMIIANSGSENIVILYGNVNGSFANQTTLSTGFGSIPQSVAIADLNNDKKVDLLVADSGNNNVLTFFRSDPAAFGNKTIYTTGTESRPCSVAVGDLNNDGWLDFVVANANSDNVGVFLGLGNGTFSSEMTYSTGNKSFPYYVAVADLNKDNNSDIIVSNHWANTIGIFFGFGNGIFSSQATYPTGNYSSPFSIAIGDLNNDSWLDIVVANSGDGSVGIFFGSDKAIFSNGTTYSTQSGFGTYSIAIGDFNNDGRLDLAVANFFTNNIVVVFGDGNGTFSRQVSYSTGPNSGPHSIAIGDFNKDGRLDLAIANFLTDNIVIVFGDGNGNFFFSANYSTGIGSSPWHLSLADLNADNQLDIAIANLGSNSFSVLLGRANGTFFNPLNYFIAKSSEPTSITIGDFNNDNRLDIIISSTNTDSVHVYFGYKSESFLFGPSYLVGLSSHPTSIAVGHFNNDTQLDAVVANNGTNNVMVLFGSDFGTFVNKISYFTGNGSNPCSVSVGDFNNDNRSDIVVANSGTNTISVFLNNGVGTFSNALTYSTGPDSQPNSVAVLDFDHNGQLDITVANFGSNNVAVFFGYGNGSFSSPMIFNTGFSSHPYAIVVGDVNKDNKSDIICINNEYGNINLIFEEC